MKYNDSKWITVKSDYKAKKFWSQTGFPSDKSFQGHFDKHGKEFGYKTKEAYLKGAQTLMSSPVYKDVIGYITDNYRRVRYNTNTNEIVIGYDGKIIT